jgi:hypothetical protein
MKEVDFYEPFALRFKFHISSVLKEGIWVDYACDGYLDTLLRLIQRSTGKELISDNTYIPKLKLDIVFAFGSIKGVLFLLVEAKYATTLSLVNYSQLLGYLSVAHFIDFGLLLLIRKKVGGVFSSDLQEILDLGSLPLQWSASYFQNSKQIDYHCGIVSYTHGNGIDWENTDSINGLSSFHRLARELNSRL